MRYRYRLCAECNDEFKRLLAEASDLWREWSADEEQNYKVERLFFMSELSVLESFGFCLYFLGGMLQSKNFRLIRTPKSITLESTSQAFTAAFPKAAITNHLADLVQSPAYATIKSVRNTLAHRLSGRRIIRTMGATSPDGTYTLAREEVWSLPGLDRGLVFDESLLQRHLDEVTCLVTELTEASLEFVQDNEPSAGHEV